MQHNHQQQPDEKNPRSRETIEAKVNQYLDRAEKIKLMLDNQRTAVPAGASAGAGATSAAAKPSGSGARCFCCLFVVVVVMMTIICCCCSGRALHAAHLYSCWYYNCFCETLCF